MMRRRRGAVQPGAGLGPIGARRGVACRRSADLALLSLAATHASDCRCFRHAEGGSRRGPPSHHRALDAPWPGFLLPAAGRGSRPRDRVSHGGSARPGIAASGRASRRAGGSHEGARNRQWVAVRRAWLRAGGHVLATARDAPSDPHASRRWHRALACITRCSARMVRALVHPTAADRSPRDACAGPWPRADLLTWPDAAPSPTSRTCSAALPPRTAAAAP